jgi:hypothetical protein
MPKGLIYITLFLLACHSSVKYPPGGYDYPEVVADKDTNFYYCPLKKILSRSDSFRETYTYKYYRQFDEPNLSLRPMPAAIFRFVYSPALGSPVIITLTQNEIIVKKAVPRNDSGLQIFPDTNLLTPIERRHIALLDRNFPIDEKRHRSPRRQHYVDSMGRLYPQLYDVAYYSLLRDKEYANTVYYYTYTTKKIKLSPTRFEQLVRQINASGYWQLPLSLPCKEYGFDGMGFSLEANTPVKYNLVGDGSCVMDSIPLFGRACQALVHEALMDKEIQLVYDLRGRHHQTIRHYRSTTPTGSP